MEKIKKNIIPNKKDKENKHERRGMHGKLPYSVVEELYYTQLSLVQIENKEFTHESIINNFRKVLELGKIIIKNDNNYVWLTGAFTNMAFVYGCLYKTNHSKEFAIRALKLVEYALELKETNQPALTWKYSLSVEIEDYTNAIDALSKINLTNTKDKITFDIIVDYQEFIKRSLVSDISKKKRKFLKDSKDILIKKCGFDSILCAVLMSYFFTIEGDSIKAYEYGKRAIDKLEECAVYSDLALICLDPQLKNYKEGLEFSRKALHLYKRKNNYNPHLLKCIKTNLFIALMENKEYAEAEILIKELIEIEPSNTNFSNYAELLKRNNRLDEAMIWVKKALYIVEDDSTLNMLADIYLKKGLFDEAIETYKRTLKMIDLNGNNYSFVEHNMNTCVSACSDKNIKKILKEAFIGLISTYCSKLDYSNANAYLKLAIEKIPGDSEWEIWGRLIPEIEKFDKEYSEAKIALEKVHCVNKSQKTFIKEWAVRLIKLQDDSIEFDLDCEKDWNIFVNEMDCILHEMGNSINHDTKIEKKIKDMIDSQYYNLENDAKHFLLTAEMLYEMNQDSIIDFAPIVIEYCKVIEIQLRKLLFDKLSYDDKMLGQIIIKIKNNRIYPYITFISDLEKINEFRRESAHTGVIEKKNVDELRELLFEKFILKKLMR